VGRDADVSTLAGVLARAGEGAGSLVLVSGEAGIGKTRLCAELSRWHRRRGGRVLLGRAAAQEASIPFAAVADALRGARRGEPAVWAAARARAEVLWAVAPELASGAGGPGRSADRPVLFEALLDAVGEAAGDGTALWVLDDLHWADDSTWEFVRYAARRVADLALVLAVAYREEEIGPSHPWWPGLVQLKREPGVWCLPLARLSAADGERIARAVGPAAARSRPDRARPGSPPGHPPPEGFTGARAGSSAWPMPASAALAHCGCEVIRRWQPRR